MDRFWNLNLIHLFNFYVWLLFLVSTYRRYGQYHAIVALILAFPGRWPQLFRLVREHHSIFLTWKTVLPALLALLLSLAQTLAANFLWPEAGRPPSGLTVARLATHGLGCTMVILLGIPMVAGDVYATFMPIPFDRPLLEKYFDQAEYWLRSWTAPVVNVFTLGFINPRKMVAVEVRKALLESSAVINSSLWWWSVLVGFRMAFGLALWLTYALHPG